MERRELEKQIIEKMAHVSKGTGREWQMHPARMTGLLF